MKIESIYKTYPAVLVLALAVAAIVGFTYLNLPVAAGESVGKATVRPLDGHARKGQSGVYRFDPMHSAIGFRIKHMGLVEVPGYFREFNGTVKYDADDVKKSSVEFTAKMASVDTGVAPRDRHLRTADFFEVEKYPEMRFESRKIVKNGKRWLVEGDLTIKDVTKRITFPFEVTGFAEQRGTLKMGIAAETAINRRDFNVNYGGNLPSGVPVLSDNVTVYLQIEAALEKQKETAAAAAESGKNR